MRHSFNAYTDATWRSFADEAYQYFDKPRDDVRLAYRLGGETCTATLLLCEKHWEGALKYLMDKVLAARSKPVTMELKNSVSGNSFNNINHTHAFVLAAARESTERRGTSH